MRLWPTKPKPLAATAKVLPCRRNLQDNECRLQKHLSRTLIRDAPRAGRALAKLDVASFIVARRRLVVVEAEWIVKRSLAPTPLLLRKEVPPP